MSFICGLGQFPGRVDAGEREGGKQKEKEGRKVGGRRMSKGGKGNASDEG